jgi:hypothetical protein
VTKQEPRSIERGRRYQRLETAFPDGTSKREQAARFLCLAFPDMACYSRYLRTGHAAVNLALRACFHRSLTVLARTVRL